MKLVVARDYDDMSELAAREIAGVVRNSNDCVLGLATGSTPIGTYKCLVDMYREGKLSFADVTTFNLDEYAGLDGSNPQSYRFFMNSHLFDKVDINKDRTHVPSGMADDVSNECEHYDLMIEEAGGIDLQLLGIGHNGHIGFNEPCEVFPKNTHEVKLSESTINANSRLFDSRDEVPRKAVTMGIGTIMAARKVLVLANGTDKSYIVRQAFQGPVTPEVPASVLQFHPDVTVIVDEEAASKWQR